MEILDLARVDLDTAAKKAASVLAKGGIVLYPTDTIYGLGVNALDRNALARLKELKGREKKKPISVIVPDIAAMAKYGVLNQKARSLAERFLPGALTLVVPATDFLPQDSMLNGNIGMRIPDDPFCLALAHAFSAPYTATSANRSGHITPHTAHGTIEHFGSFAHNIDLVIDGGPRTSGVPSTVVLCKGEDTHVLRDGALSREELGL